MSPITLRPGDRFDSNRDRIQAGLAQPMPQARVYNNANLSINNATVTALTFNSERFDNGDLHSTSSNTGRLTAPITGLYDIGCHVSFAAHATGTREVRIRLNGSTVIALDERQAVTVAAVPTVVSLPTTYQLAAGEWVDVAVYQDSGGSLNVLASGNYSPEFWMVRLGGYVNMGVS